MRSHPDGYRADFTCPRTLRKGVGWVETDEDGEELVRCNRCQGRHQLRAVEFRVVVAPCYEP